MLYRPLLLAALGALSLSLNTALAQNCEVTIDSNDQMRYDTDRVEVPKSCSEFTVNLTHSGQLPKNVMGHNWVLTKSEDMQGVVSDGVAAGLDNDYLKPNDERVIAATPMIGGGEQTSVTFSVSALQEGQDYTFFCSFPGHSALMKGSLVLVD
ncbi:MAG: azurin [Xanthomonadaceae bacterium]|mgnify:CR=1 FL=1|nr:azurin [Xanthomonadaceae bacterium]